MQPVHSVLIVEDEPIIAMMLEEYLDLLGHDVTGTADNVSEALAIVDGGGFDLAILDVSLRDGVECWPVADALAARKIPFILASGGSGTAQGGVPGCHAILEKPYALADVRAAIERLKKD